MLRPVYSLRAASQSGRSPSTQPVPLQHLVSACALEHSAARSVIAFLFGALLLLRFCLTDPLWNQVVNYTDDGGSLLEKIHPATYGIMALLVFSLLRFQVVLSAGEARIVRQFLTLIAIIFGLSATLQAAGRSVSMGYLLETYIGGCLTGVMLLVLRPAQRRAIGHMIICYLAVNAALAILEKTTSQRLMPYNYVELSFRPTALTSHPLALGLMHAGAVIFVLATRWGAAVKGALLVLIVLGAFAAGARTGAIVASLAAVAGIVLTSVQSPSLGGRFRLKSIILIGLLLTGPLVVLGADAAGFLERFQGGYFDDNAKARVDVYQVFDWVSTNEILFGTDLLEIRQMVFERLGLLIESSVVIFVFQFGLFGALLLTGAIFWTFFRAAWGREPRAYVAVVAYIATASSNNALSGKHPLFMMMIVLLLAFRREGQDAFGRIVTLGWGARA